MAQQNVEVPPDQRIEFRMVINLEATFRCPDCAEFGTRPTRKA
jgi:hypothetical protein